MAMSRTKKKVLLIVFGSIGGVILTVLFIVFFGMMMSSYVDYGSYYNECVRYKDEVEYFSGTVDKIKIDEKKREATISFSWVDVNDYMERYKDSVDRYGRTRNIFSMPYYSNSFTVYGKTFDMLVESDFFDVVYQDTVVTIHTYRSSPNDGYPIMGVSVGDEEYVSFETGFQNWLDYLQQMSQGRKRQTPIKEYKPEN